MAVIARQSPQGVEAEVETRNRSTSGRVSISTTDTAGGRMLAARVDTLVMPPPPSGMGPNVQIRGGENPTGATLRGPLAAGGAASHLIASGPATARQLDESVLFLVPSLPPTLAPGASWADTSRYEIEAGESRVILRIVSDYRVTGGDERTGFHVAREFRLERTSRTNEQQREVLIETRANGRTDYVLDAERVVVSMTTVRDIETDMHLPDVDRVLSAGTSDTVEVNRIG